MASNGTVEATTSVPNLTRRGPLPRDQFFSDWRTPGGKFGRINIGTAVDKKLHDSKGTRTKSASHKIHAGWSGAKYIAGPPIKEKGNK